MPFNTAANIAAIKLNPIIIKPKFEILPGLERTMDNPEKPNSNNGSERIMMAWEAVRT